MPHLKSAEKHLRKTKKRTAAANRIRSKVKSYMKEVKDLPSFVEFQKAVDKAVKRGVVTHAKAGRLKSRVYKTVALPKPKVKDLERNRKASKPKVSHVKKPRNGKKK